MIILGIDPGTHRIGYGLIRSSGTSLSYIGAGLLEVAGEGPARLESIQTNLETLITQNSPERVGVEKLFFSANRKTAIAVSHARGVILATASRCGVPVSEYTPNEVKLATTGYGSADKRAVEKMVRLLLKMPREYLIDDAIDALAIAITASRTFVS